MRALRLVACCAVLLLPSACFVSRVDSDRAAEALNAPNICCADLSRASPIAFKSGGSFGITPNSDVHDFGDDGKSFFRLIDIATAPAGSAMLLRSQIVSSNEHQVFFYPAVEALDEHFNVIKKIAPEEGELNMNVTHGASDLRFQLDGEAKARYLVIYTTQKIIRDGKSLPRKERAPYPHAPFGPGMAVIGHVIGADKTLLPALGEVPYYGSAVSSESGLTLYALSSIDQKAPN